MGNYDEYIIDELWEGLITPHTRVTFEIQFMLRSQRFEIIALHISRVDVAGSAELVLFARRCHSPSSALQISIVSR